MIYYERVKVSELERMGLDSLKGFLNRKTRKGRFEVTKKNGDILLFKFFSKETSKPCLVLLKRTGRFAMFKDSWENLDMRKLASHEVGILLEILDSIDLVKSFKRRYFSWLSYPVEKFGYAPRQDTPRLGVYEKREEEGKLIWE